MKKFLLKSSLFSIPFLIIHFINLTFYNQKEGDLVRLGYLYPNPSPKSKIDNQYSIEQKFTALSELNLNKKSQFDIITIGDSFSDQDSLGYNNFLANDGESVLHIDFYFSWPNPIQRLIQLTNGDFFDSVNTDVVVLEYVERYFVQGSQEIEFSRSISLNSIKNKINNDEKKDPNLKLNLLSDATLKIPLYNFQYLLNGKPKNSITYKVATNTDSLFTGNPKDLLFYQDEFDNLKHKNDSLKIVNSIHNLNKLNTLLSKKNIKLIVLISPDKYDIYFPYIEKKENFKEPHFFKYYNSISKDYVDINSFEVLKEEIRNNKDVYYYDDSHWSPIGAQVIASEIKKEINKLKPER